MVRYVNEKYQLINQMSAEIELKLTQIKESLTIIRGCL